MEINSETLELVKRWEGLRLEAYPDPGSKDGNPWTIGYGHTSDSHFKVSKGVKITKTKATELLKLDLEEAKAVVLKYVKVPLTDNQLGALVSFVFNLGETVFAKSTLLKKLNQGKYNEVPTQLNRFIFNDGAIMEGLVNRRAAENGLWAKGSFVASNTVVAEPVKEPIFTKENVGWGTGAVVSVITASATSGPLQIALAFGLGIAFLVGGFLFVKSRLNPK